MQKKSKLLKKVQKAIRHLSKVESMLSELEESRPTVYIDEDMALLTTLNADIEYIKNKNLLKNGLSEMPQENSHGS